LALALRSQIDGLSFSLDSGATVLQHPATYPHGTSLVRRIVRFPLVTLLVGIVFMIGASMVGTRLAEFIGASRSGPGAVVGGIVVALIFMLAYVAFTRLVEQRPAVEFDRKGWLAELAVGVVIGAILFAAVVGVIALAGGYRIIGTRPLSVLYPIIGISIVSGVTEEIMLRGIFFRIVEGWLGSWIALLLSAALFGALHLGNPNASLIAGGAIAVEAGVMLAAVFMLTRRLWAAIGLHAAWNFTQGGIFGIAVSGFDTAGLFQPQISGPAWLTGGEFGAEASLPAVAICSAFGVGLLLLAYRRGRFIKPFWAKPA